MMAFAILMIPLGLIGLIIEHGWSGFAAGALLMGLICLIGWLGGRR